MAKASPVAIEQYKNILRADPNSKVFAVLAESYRESQDLEQAQKLALDGIRRHPQYAPGFLVLARVELDKKSHETALEYLNKALSLDPQNLLALFLTASTYLHLGNNKASLSHFKKLLFLNPQHAKAKMAVEKLENLSAEEYSEDIFQMQKLKAAKDESSLFDLKKQLSLLDAFLVRDDVPAARILFQKMRMQFGDDPELKRRELLLMDKIDSSKVPDRAAVKRKKVAVLKALLHRITEKQLEN